MSAEINLEIILWKSPSNSETAVQIQQELLRGYKYEYTNTKSRKNKKKNKKTFAHISFRMSLIDLLTCKVEIKNGFSDKMQ